jgi:two-component system chemotaxis response regulator CheB
VKARRIRPTDKIRVLVVDDSVVVRRMVTAVIQSDPQLEVVHAAASGALAMQRIRQDAPDVVTLDVEMPEMDGLETLAAIRRDCPDLPVVMLSGATEAGAAVTLDALARGADDYVRKPAGAGGSEQAMALLGRELLPKLRQFFVFSPEPPVAAPEKRQHTMPERLAPSGGFAPPKAEPIEAVAIAVSTGGPAALAEVLPKLPATFPVPILIVQHMPATFTRLLAERLNSKSRIPVTEAAEGDLVERGHAYIAPGDFHMTLERSGGQVVIRLNQSVPVHSCRPAADVLLRAVTEVYGPRALGVVLTGMGCDGAAGLRSLRASGGRVLAQDEATSVVWGMPGEVVRQGLATAVMPLHRIAGEIVNLAGAQ